MADLFALFQVHQIGSLSIFDYFALPDLEIRLSETRLSEIQLRYILGCLLVDDDPLLSAGNADH